MPAHNSCSLAHVEQPFCLRAHQPKQGSPLRGEYVSKIHRTGEPMTSPMLQHIPLTNAYLCQDCDCVGNCATQCPACASSALLGLSCVLNRKGIEEEIPAANFTFSSVVHAPALAA